jgi:hypothetical protein
MLSERLDMEDKKKQQGGIFITEGTEVILNPIPEDIEIDLFMGGDIRKFRVNGHILDYEKFLEGRGASPIDEDEEQLPEADSVEVPLEDENGSSN